MTHGRYVPPQNELIFLLVGGKHGNPELRRGERLCPPIVDRPDSRGRRKKRSMMRLSITVRRRCPRADDFPFPSFLRILHFIPILPLSRSHRFTRIRESNRGSPFSSRDSGERCGARHADFTSLRIPAQRFTTYQALSRVRRMDGPCSDLSSQLDSLPKNSCKIPLPLSVLVSFHTWPPRTVGFTAACGTTRRKASIKHHMDYYHGIDQFDPIFLNSNFQLLCAHSDGSAVFINVLGN